MHRTRSCVHILHKDQLRKMMVVVKRVNAPVGSCENVISCALTLVWRGEYPASPNRYISDAKFCFCKNNKRIIINPRHPGPRFDPRRPHTPHERTLHPGTPRTCTLLYACRAAVRWNKAAASAHGMGSGGLSVGSVAIGYLGADRRGERFVRTYPFFQPSFLRNRPSLRPC